MRAWNSSQRYHPTDSAKLLFGDRDQNLQILDIKTKKVTNVDKARRGDIRYYDWSPDSKWVVYVKFGENRQDAVWVYSLEQSRSFQVTDDIYIDFSPVFSTCGQYLFFLSDRDFNRKKSPSWSTKSPQRKGEESTGSSRSRASSAFFTWIG
jgi:tricorn protease